ncbi:MAG: hypothetical protein WC404_07440, partial [Candidatus Omnitrophota bacterium]
KVGVYLYETEIADSGIIYDAEGLESLTAEAYIELAGTSSSPVAGGSLDTATVLIICQSGIFRSRLLAYYLSDKLKGMNLNIIFRARLMADNSKIVRSIIDEISDSLQKNGGYNAALRNFLYYAPIRQVTEEEINIASIILVATERIRNRLTGRYPEAQDKIYLISSFLPAELPFLKSNKDIPDLGERIRPDTNSKYFLEEDGKVSFGAADLLGLYRQLDIDGIMKALRSNGPAISSPLGVSSLLTSYFNAGYHTQEQLRPIVEGLVAFSKSTPEPVLTILKAGFIQNKRTLDDYLRVYTKVFGKDGQLSQADRKLKDSFFAVLVSALTSRLNDILENLDLSAEDMENALWLVENNHFNDYFKTDANWGLAVAVLVKISTINPGIVIEKLKYQDRTPSHTLKEYELKYASVLGNEKARKLIADMFAFANELIKRGKDIEVFVNATFEGGGVSEMFRTAMGIFKELGMTTYWEIIYPFFVDFYNITKSIHNSMQGNDMPLADKQVEQWIAAAIINIYIFRQLFRDKRVASAHIEDSQPLPLITDLPLSAYFRAFELALGEGAAKKLSQQIVDFDAQRNNELRKTWRFHIDIAGIAKKNPGAMKIWSKMLEYLSRLTGNDAIMFQPCLVPSGLSIEASVLTQYPGIDPLAEKNREMDYGEMAGLIGQVNKAMEETSAGLGLLPIDIRKAAIITGARADYWKGLLTALRVFIILAKSGVIPEDVDFVLFCGGATDDCEARDQIALFKNVIKDCPAELKSRMHLVVNQSGRRIGALYKYGAIHQMPFIALSLREGYNLMTDEASVQGQASITSNVGGLGRYKDGVDAWVVDILELVNRIESAANLYQWRENGLRLGQLAEDLEKLLMQKLAGIFGLRRNYPREYARAYEEIAKEAKLKTYEQSLLPMIRNYLALAAVDKETLSQVAAERTSGNTPSADRVAELLSEKLAAASSPVDITPEQIVQIEQVLSEEYKGKKFASGETYFTHTKRVA